MHVQTVNRLDFFVQGSNFQNFGKDKQSWKKKTQQTNKTKKQTNKKSAFTVTFNTVGLICKIKFLYHFSHVKRYTYFVKSSIYTAQNLT